MAVEESIVIESPASVVYEIYKDVEHWCDWDPDTKSSYLSNGFQLGSRGRIVPTKGMGVPMELVAFVENRSFTVKAWIPGFVMWFDHELKAVGAGTEVVHRARFDGVLSFLFVAKLTRQIREGLPHTLQSLKTLAESRRTR